MHPENGLALSGRRRAFLELLDAEPAYKRDIVDAVDESRSTVGRAVAELEAVDLITRDGDGRFAITGKGRLFLDTYLESLEILETGNEAAPLLDHLPDDIRIPPGFFVDASVTIAQGPDPTEGLREVFELLSTATEARILARADHAPEIVRLGYRRAVIDEAMDINAVINRAMVDRIETEYATLIDGVEESPQVQVSVLDPLPFGLYVLEDGTDKSVILITHDENLVYRGFILSKSPWALDWAADAFESRWTRAEPFL